MKLVKLSLVFLALTFSSCSPQQFQEVLDTLNSSGALTQGEVSSGLKQALEIGIGKGSDQLSALDATGYLNDKTNAKLYNAFNPVIVNSLDKFQARKYWSDAVTAYNKIPFIQKADPSLDNYVTTQALKGLFSMVEKEEVNIRKNVSARTSDLLKKVFAKQDNK